MKKFISVILFSFLIFQFGSAQHRERIGEIKWENDSVFVSIDGKLYVANREVVTVKLKSGVDKVKAGFKTLRQNQLGYIDITVPDSIDLEEYVAQLDKTGYYEVVEYNSFGEYCFTPNDTRIANQWYLSNINAYSAWDITMGSPDLIVAVLDSGTDWMHPDIGMGVNTYQNIYLNSGEDDWQIVNNPQTGNGIDDDNNGFIDDWKGWNFETNNNNVRTINGHGTRVAGIVAAKSNNVEGIAGIAGGNNSEGTRIMPVCTGANAPDGSVIDDAIIYAVNSGARIIQLSLSVARTNAIDDAIAFAIANDVVIVCSSGNGHASTVYYPASHQNVIAVGATTQNNTRAGFSNYGSALDVVAPGVDILSTTLNNGYNSQDGTSFAAPQVSGVAALILSVNPCLTQSEVRYIIESTAQKVGGYSYATTSGRPNGTWNSQMGYGLVDAYAAVQVAYLHISGPSIVCNTNTTFSLNNLSPNLFVTWTKSNNLTYVSGQDSANYTVKSTGPATSGEGWVQITMNGPCGSISL